MDITITAITTMMTEMRAMADIMIMELVVAMMTMELVLTEVSMEATTMVVINWLSYLKLKNKDLNIIIKSK